MLNSRRNALNFWSARKSSRAPSGRSLRPSRISILPSVPYQLMPLMWNSMPFACSFPSLAPWKSSGVPSAETMMCRRSRLLRFGMLLT